MPKRPSRKARKKIKSHPELYKNLGIDAAEKNAAKLEYSDINWIRSVREQRHQNWLDQALISWGKESSRKPMEKTPAARQKTKLEPRLEEIRGIRNALESKKIAGGCKSNGKEKTTRPNTNNRPIRKRVLPITN